ncbi:MULTISPECIES: Rho-binding antiterminator [Pseudomonas]|uniref:Transcriptional antiterminator n=1 Tax=Pseudomonas rhizophila TaxID=2045200 RepID=A0ABN5JLZ9_9PSED|nr:MULTISPECIES: Rho-binding antiterminator [Pseudomonas]AVU74218.1 transcriptional antiterminator [Pseudomonas rhizophila]QKJ37658.1 Rho-binding antiterminator [Pseudomonas sp. MPDS]
MSTYKPLHCDLHDYLEIACLCGYTLDIELTNGQRLTARAITTRTASTREEFLEVETTDGRQEIRLDQLLAVTPQDKNARFGRVVLGDE